MRTVNFYSLLTNADVAVQADEISLQCSPPPALVVAGAESAGTGTLATPRHSTDGLSRGRYRRGWFCNSGLCLCWLGGRELRPEGSNGRRELRWRYHRLLCGNIVLQGGYCRIELRWCDGWRWCGNICLQGGDSVRELRWCDGWLW
jgi:hypothetical protein